MFQCRMFSGTRIPSLSTVGMLPRAATTDNDEHGDVELHLRID